MMGLQFGLTARFRHVTAPLGEDVIYHFHRQISLAALALIIAHPVILWWLRPERMAALDLLEASWRTRYTSFSGYALIAIVVTSLRRKRLRLSYEAWHAAHAVLAVVAIDAGLLHMVGWSIYLRSPLKYWLRLGLSLFWLVLLIYVRALRPFLLRRPYRVARVIPERGKTWTIVLQPVGHPCLRFAPGQFGWLTVYGTPFGITGHPFSFSSSADDPSGLDITTHELGDFTRTIGRVPADARVRVDGHYGASAIKPKASHLHVLIAGGVGITPLMSMLRTLADRGDWRPLRLIYGSSDWESVTFREALDTLTPRLNLTMVHVLESPPDGWTGEQGYGDTAMLRRHVPDPCPDHEYFICGPAPMMDEVETVLRRFGVPLARYHSERYDLV